MYGRPKGRAPENLPLRPKYAVSSRLFFICGEDGRFLAFPSFCNLFLFFCNIYLTFW